MTQSVGGEARSSSFGRDRTWSVDGTPRTADVLKRYSWIPLLAGIWALVAGLLTIVWPGGTVLALAIIFGVYLVIAGPTYIVHALRLRNAAPEWGWVMLRGAADLALGIITLVWPGITVTVLAILFGVEVLLLGSFEIAAALRVRAARDDWGWYLARGIVAVLVGIVTIVWPDITVFALALLLGIFLVYLGVILIAGAMRLRRVARAVV